MLKIVIPTSELFDERTQTFINIKEQTLSLEHSLVAFSKWESKWRKPFLSKKPKTAIEFADYIRCMTLTQNVNPQVYTVIPLDIFRQVSAYIDAPMTATTFPPSRKRGSGHEIVTSEIIYYWMVSYGIPFECQKWHLNRLLTLIKVCHAKNQQPEKIPRAELLARNRALNAARRKKWNTRG